VVTAVLDTSVIIEILDGGSTDVVDELLDKYRVLYIPWISLYEYLYGHKYIGKNPIERKKLVERLGVIIWVTQNILLRALELDVSLSKKGLKIPFSDVLIAATAFEMNSELVTMDVRHFSRIPGLKVYIPKSK